MTALHPDVAQRARLGLRTATEALVRVASLLPRERPGGRAPVEVLAMELVSDAVRTMRVLVNGGENAVPLVRQLERAAGELAKRLESQQ